MPEAAYVAAEASHTQGQPLSNLSAFMLNRTFKVRITRETIAEPFYSARDTILSQASTLTQVCANNDSSLKPGPQISAPLLRRSLGIYAVPIRRAAIMKTQSRKHGGTKQACVPN
jgi:hypothetical protein